MQMAARGWQSALQTETGGEGPEARFALLRRHAHGAWGHLMSAREKPERYSGSDLLDSSLYALLGLNRGCPEMDTC